MTRVQKPVQILFKWTAIGDFKVIEQAIRARENHGDLLLNRKRHVLILFQNFRQPLPAIQLCQRRFVQV